MVSSIAWLLLAILSAAPAAAPTGSSPNDPSTAEPEVVLPSHTVPDPTPDNQPAPPLPPPAAPVPSGVTQEQPPPGGHPAPAASPFAAPIPPSGPRAAAGEPRIEVELGARGQLVLSAERLLGVGHNWSTRPGYYAGQGETSSTSTFWVLSNVPDFDTTPGNLPVSFTSPRLAADLFITRRLSVGLAAGYFHISSSYPTETVVVSGFTLAPRAGFSLPIARDVAIWLRAGISFIRASEPHTDLPTEVVQLLDATFEAPVIIRALPHIAFTLGPTLDLGIAGHANQNAPGGPVSETALGVEVGVSGIFGGP